MEEILASIRRIIEDSDAVRSPADEGVPEDVEVASPSAVSAPSLQPTNDEPEVVAFRSGLEDAASASDPEPSYHSSGFAAEDAPAASDVDVETEADIHPLHGDVRPLEPVAYASPLDDVAAPSFGRGDDRTVHVDAALEPAAQELEPEQADDGKLSLISEQAGRQVAAAFGELSEVFAASRRRSFDEVAEEMLRPMLQDWLDNNLPTLVEKLVREEIERVARGG